MILCNVANYHQIGNISFEKQFSIISTFFLNKINNKFAMRKAILRSLQAKTDLKVH